LTFKGVAKVRDANDFSKILTLEIRVACNSEQPFFCFFLLFQKNFVFALFFEWGGGVFAPPSFYRK